MSARGKIRVGIGGWVFPPWRSTFYPKGLKQAEELSHAETGAVLGIKENTVSWRMHEVRKRLKTMARQTDD